MNQLESVAFDILKGEAIIWCNYARLEFFLINEICRKGKDFLHFFLEF